MPAREVAFPANCRVPLAAAPLVRREGGGAADVQGAGAVFPNEDARICPSRAGKCATTEVGHADGAIPARPDGHAVESEVDAAAALVQHGSVVIQANCDPIVGGEGPGALGVGGKRSGLAPANVEFVGGIDGAGVHPDEALGIGGGGDSNSRTGVAVRIEGAAINDDAPVLVGDYTGGDVAIGTSTNKAARGGAGDPQGAVFGRETVIQHVRTGQGERAGAAFHQPEACRCNGGIAGDVPAKGGVGGIAGEHPFGGRAAVFNVPRPGDLGGGEVARGEEFPRLHIQQTTDVGGVGGIGHVNIAGPGFDQAHPGRRSEGLGDDQRICRGIQPGLRGAEGDVDVLVGGRGADGHGPGCGINRDAARANGEAGVGGAALQESGARVIEQQGARGLGSVQADHRGAIYGIDIKYNIVGRDRKGRGVRRGGGGIRGPIAQHPPACGGAIPV